MQSLLTQTIAKVTLTRITEHGFFTLERGEEEMALSERCLVCEPLEMKHQSLSTIQERKRGDRRNSSPAAHKFGARRGLKAIRDGPALWLLSSCASVSRVTVLGFGMDLVAYPDLPVFPTASHLAFPPLPYSFSAKFCGPTLIGPSLRRISRGRKQPKERRDQCKPSFLFGCLKGLEGPLRRWSLPLVSA